MKNSIFIKQLFRNHNLFHCAESAAGNFHYVDTGSCDVERHFARNIVFLCHGLSQLVEDADIGGSVEFGEHFAFAGVGVDAYSGFGVSSGDAFGFVFGFNKLQFVNKQFRAKFHSRASRGHNHYLEHVGNDAGVVGKGHVIHFEIGVGVGVNEVLVETPVLNGLTIPFPAPHARYAELDHDQIRQTPGLTINAVSSDDYLLSLTGSDNQDFLFAHLEYDRLALLAEYQRETAAHPDRHYALPKNYFKDINTLTDPQFKWEKVQQLYFKNWLQKTAEYSQNALTIA